MGIMDGKKGIIFGVSNKRGIGYAIANAIYREGGQIAFTYANELMKNRVQPIAEEMKSKLHFCKNSSMIVTVHVFLQKIITLCNIHSSLLFDRRLI